MTSEEPPMTTPPAGVRIDPASLPADSNPNRLIVALAGDAEHLARGAEIDRLREWLDLRDGELASANAQRDQARAENDRLRGLLTEALDGWADGGLSWGSAGEMHARIAEIRRGAGLS